VKPPVAHFENMPVSLPVYVLAAIERARSLPSFFGSSLFFPLCAGGNRMEFFFFPSFR